MRTIGGPYKDLANYFINAPSIDGAVVPAGLLNASGFDPSLFHDDDGRR